MISKFFCQTRFNKYNVLTKENNVLKNYSWIEKKIIGDGNGVKPSSGSLQCAHINIIIIIIFLNKGPLKISECRHPVHGVYTHCNIIGMRFRFIFTPYRTSPRHKCSEVSILQNGAILGHTKVYTLAIPGVSGAFYIIQTSDE